MRRCITTRVVNTLHPTDVRKPLSINAPSRPLDKHVRNREMQCSAPRGRALRSGSRCYGHVPAARRRGAGLSQRRELIARPAVRALLRAADRGGQFGIFEPGNEELTLRSAVWNPRLVKFRLMEWTDEMVGAWVRMEPSLCPVSWWHLGH